MNCKANKIDICQLTQETWRGNTLVFPSEISIQDDNFIYNIYRYDNLIKSIELPIEDNKVEIIDPELQEGEYYHEIIWTHENEKYLIFQGVLTITQQPTCNCCDDDEEDLNIEVNTGDTIIQISIVGSGGGGGQILTSGNAINIENGAINVKVDNETIIINANNELEVVDSKYVLPTASEDVKGGVMVDGTSTVMNGNVIKSQLIDVNTNTIIIKHWIGTQSQYNAITTKDSSTIYLIRE